MREVTARRAERLAGYVMLSKLGAAFGVSLAGRIAAPLRML